MGKTVSSIGLLLLLGLTESSTNAQVFNQSEVEINPAMTQVTSVSTLSDVKPTDWAFSALQGLVERYGCIAGYPDRTYRGNKAITRYEFAAGLEACLVKVNEIVSSGLAEKVSKEDLATLQKLQAEFSTELNTVKGRIDALEGKVATLETQQFSTIAKFGGEVIFGLAGGTGAPSGLEDPNVVFPYLARLGIVASFSGSDRLRLGLQSSNFGSSESPLGLGSFENLSTYNALLSYQATTDSQFVIDNLEYRFPAFNDRVVFTVRPAGFSLGSVLTTNSPYFDTGRGAISRFAEASPLFKIGNLTAGAGFDWLVNSRLRLQVAYGSADSGNPSPGGGIAGSNNSALGVQFLVRPAESLWTGISYINAYSAEGRLNTLTGSFAADNSGNLTQSEDANGNSVLNFDNAVGSAQIHAISGTLNWAISPTLRFGAWGGWTFANSTDSGAYANTTTYLFSLGVSEPFGRGGDLVAFLFGQPPRLKEGVSRSGNPIGDETTGLHYELFYRFRVSRNISITPGFFVVTNPNHELNREAIWVGSLRTVFRF